MTKIYECSIRSQLSKQNSVEAGFGASVAVILLSAGAMALTLTVAGAVSVYADQVYLKERRIQKALDQQACADTAMLVREKDTYASGDIYLSEFGCTVSL